MKFNSWKSWATLSLSWKKALLIKKSLNTFCWLSCCHLIFDHFLFLPQARFSCLVSWSCYIVFQSIAVNSLILYLDFCWIRIPRSLIFRGKVNNFASAIEYAMPPVVACMNSGVRMSSIFLIRILMFGMVRMWYVNSCLYPLTLPEVQI